jgi:hypothetical protein
MSGRYDVVMKSTSAAQVLGYLLLNGKQTPTGMAVLSDPYGELSIPDLSQRRSRYAMVMNDMWAAGYLDRELKEDGAYEYSLRLYTIVETYGGEVKDLTHFVRADMAYEHFVGWAEHLLKAPFDKEVWDEYVANNKTVYVLLSAEATK